MKRLLRENATFSTAYALSMGLSIADLREASNKGYIRFDERKGLCERTVNGQYWAMSNDL